MGRREGGLLTTTRFKVWKLLFEDMYSGTLPPKNEDA